VSGLCHRERAVPCEAVDLRDPKAIENTVESVRPDIIVHCAAYADPDFCETRPDETRRLNVDPLHVFRKALHDRGRLVLISTDYVFDGEHAPYSEDDPVAPLNEYGRSKVAAEKVVREAGGLILRCPVLIDVGENVAQCGFLERLFKALANGKPCAIDDFLVRYPTFTWDVAEAMVFLLEAGLDGCFHVSGREGGTQYDWTVRMAEQVGLPADHVKRLSDPAPKPARRPRDAHLDTSKIEGAGFSRFSSFSSIMEAFRGRFLV
jgi:dTDP-4-dehydrorhamnose reductase